MFLKELLDTDIDYKVIRATPKSFNTRATIGENDILFTAYKVRDDEGLNAWMIEFAQVSTDAGHEKFTFRKTGTGMPFHVFSMIKKSIEEFLERYQPDEIHFTAETSDGAARLQVYKKLFARALKSYTLVSETEQSGDTLLVYRSRRIIPA